MRIAVGAVVILGAGGAFAQQPPPGPVAGPLEPPRFVPAPVPEATAEKVKKSMTDVDPFEEQAPTAAAPAKPAATLPPLAATPSSTGEPKAPAPVPAPPAPTVPSSEPSPAATPTTPVPVPPAAPSPPAPLPRSDSSAAGPGMVPYEETSRPDPGLASRAPEASSGGIRAPVFAVQAGGGIMSFAGQEMKDLAGAGGYWDARVVMGLRWIVALEAAYVGVTSQLSAPGVAEGSSLLGNGVEGTLRLNIPISTGDGTYVLPFGVAGLGWQNLRITNGGTDGTMLAQADDIMTIPLGGGLAIGYRHLYLDTRFIYRYTRYEDLIPANGRSSDHLRQWTFGANVGYAF
jgi:hypothetical protein